jgi:hypothetical protein
VLLLLWLFTSGDDPPAAHQVGQAGLRSFVAPLSHLLLDLMLLLLLLLLLLCRRS